MGHKSIKGSKELAKSIKLRREALGLTIKDAASKAGVGTKTWSRYESGKSIRKDKCGGVCKALKWQGLPVKDDFDMSNTLNLNEYRKHKAWSPYLMDRFGKFAAISFVIGSDILLDNLCEDMESLSSMPKGSHIGEIDVSWMESLLPSQFLMKYDYDFLYILRYTINRFRLIAPVGKSIIAHSVIEELVLYLIVEESRFLMESIGLNMERCDTEAYDIWDEWVFDIFEDADLIYFLYSGKYLVKDDTYHFDRWLEKQFFCQE